jgi:hypothetical protein
MDVVLGGWQQLLHGASPIEYSDNSTSCLAPLVHELQQVPSLQ